MHENDPLDFDDETLGALTSHEREARSEVLEWRDSGGGPLQSALSAVQDKAGSALQWATPRVAQETVRDAIEGGLEMVQDASRLTFRASSVLKEAQKDDIEADEVSDLADAPLSALDALSARYHMPNKLLAAGEGGVCGAGGVGAAAADLPLLFGVAFRGVQQVGTCYGFDMDDPDVRPAVLGIFNVGAGAGSAAKARFLVDIHVAAEAFAKRWTYQQVAERTATGTAAQTLKRMTRRLPQRIAHKVTKQKLAQALPLIGAAVGGTFNYQFVGRTLTAARMAFRSLYLRRKYGRGPAPARQSRQS
jgi:hypothetical protein